MVEDDSQSEARKNSQDVERPRQEGIDPVLILFSPDSNVGNIENGCKSPVKIDLNDVQPEIDFWNSAINCYVFGANPPPYVMEGFIRSVEEPGFGKSCHN